MYRNTIYLLSILSITFGCTNNKLTAQNELSFKKFPKAESVTPKFYLKYNEGKGIKMLLKDSLLFVRNSNMTVKTNFVYMLNLQTGKLKDSLFKQGGDENEIISPMSMGLTSNQIWMHDFSAKKIEMINVDELINSHKSKLTIRDFKFKSIFYSIQIGYNKRLYVNGQYDRPFKIQEIDLTTGGLIKEFGNYGDGPSAVPVVAWRKANESFLFIQPNEKNIVSASRFTDKIEIFDLTTLKSKVIKGPENYEPEFNFMKIGDVDLMERNKKTKFAFVNGYTTNKYIYLLYSGNNHESPYLDYGKFIFIYDWDGKPVKKINLPAYISSFAIKDDEEAYVFDVSDNTIKQFLLNL